MACRAGLFRILAALALPGLAACGTMQSPPSFRLALEGPPLAIAAELDGRVFSGSMERSCLAGLGYLELWEEGGALLCRGNMDSPPSDKARLHASLECSDGSGLYLLLRNVGPDQGLGIGRFEGSEETLELFYHPGRDEAIRRLAEFQEDLEAAFQQ